MSLTKVTRTVVDSISSFFGINNTTGAITSVVPDLMPSNSTLYPSFACRAWVNFHGVQSGTLTYAISGNLVTITQSSHGMTTGMIANLTFSTGTVSGTANYVVTRVNDNSYTVTVGVSGSTGGSVVRNTFIRACGNVNGVSRTAAGDYTVNFTTALPDANFCPVSIGAQNVTGNYPWSPTLIRDNTPFNVNSIRISYEDTSNGVSIDVEHACVAVFR